MAQMTPLVSELLARALTLSSYERGQLIDQLVASLDNDPPDEGVSAAWDEEIKPRVADIRLGRVRMIPGEQALARLKARLHDAKK
jgi:putative addiction module component (TIGR02574 family)